MKIRHAVSVLSVSSFLNSSVFSSFDVRNKTAKPGENVTLPCKAAENKPVMVLEWSRKDSGEHEHVASYIDDTFDYQNQHPAYRGRVDSQDREMKDGDVSLVSKDVMINDKGTYECRVVHGEHKRRKRSHLDSDPVCIINSDVSPPGNSGQQNDHEKNNSGPTVGLSVGVSIAVLALLGVVGFSRYKRQRRPPQEQNTPPAAGEELQPMNAENGGESEK